MSALRVLHLHSSFNPGDKELRAAQLMNAFGTGIEHTVVSAEPESLGAASAVDRRIDVAYPTDFPALAGTPTPARLQRLARAMADFDLVLTYNWGAMDAVLAHTVFSRAYRLPPLVHHEDGFNSDEADRLKRSRNWYRRIALGRTSALIVPSQRLRSIALDAWQQPPSRVKLVLNGINTPAYAKTPGAGALPRVIKRKGERWLGTLAGLRTVKDLPRLVRAFSVLPDEWQLVILGEGPEREAIRAEALRLDVAHRVHLPGFIANPAGAVGLFDLFALSSQSEQFPISVVEAMAAGLAVVAPAVGDVADMVAAENRPYISAAGDEGGLVANLVTLASDKALRARIGAANMARARAEYDEKTMIARYSAIYARALRRSSFP